MGLLCVNGTKVSITVMGAQQLVKVQDSIPATSANKLYVAGKPALTIKDIEAWLPLFLTDYINAAYAGGKAMGSQVAAEQNLTLKITSADALLTKDSIVDAELLVNMPGQDPVPSPDSQLQIKIKLQFTDPAQTKVDLA